MCTLQIIREASDEGLCYPLGLAAIIPFKHYIYVLIMTHVAWELGQGHNCREYLKNHRTIRFHGQQGLKVSLPGPLDGTPACNSTYGSQLNV